MSNSKPMSLPGRLIPLLLWVSIIAFNHSISPQTAQKIIDSQFVEMIIAPEISVDVLAIFAKKPNIRILYCGDLKPINQSSLDYKRVQGGLLVQNYDLIDLDPAKLRIVTKRKATQAELSDLTFAWRVAKYVKSNAIVFAKDQRTIGIGAGQMSRVDSTKIATLKAAEANLTVKGSVMASECFLPLSRCH